MITIKTVTTIPTISELNIWELLKSPRPSKYLFMTYQNPIKENTLDAASPLYKAFIIAFEPLLSLTKNVPRIDAQIATPPIINGKRIASVEPWKVRFPKIIAAIVVTA